MSYYLKALLTTLEIRLLNFLLNRLENRRACSSLPDSSQIVDAAVYLREVMAL